MPDIIVRFVAEHDFVSRAIRWVTMAEFSHTEIGLPDGSWLGAHASGGVRIMPADYMIPSLERVYAIPVDDSAHHKAMNFAQTQLGTGYSFIDILGILFRAHFAKAPHGLICSWFVMDVLRAAGIVPLNVLGQYDYKVTPTMLHLSPIFIGKCVRQSGAPV